MVKNGYYGNEGFGLPWDHIKVCQIGLFTTTGVTFVKKNSCLVARVVSFDTVGLYVLTFHILEPCPSKDILTIMVLS